MSMEISLYKNTKEILLTISDNANGIQIKPVEKFFEPFMSNKFQGIGMGLYIAKKL